MAVVPLAHPAATRTPATAQAVVETFLATLAAPDLARAATLLDDGVVYVNVGLLPVRGARRVASVLAPLARRGLGFEVYLHAIAATEPEHTDATGTAVRTVLTERTDVLIVGPVRLQFWVSGRFDVRDGRITLWRDSFDYLDVLRSVGRGVLGAVLPVLAPAPPSSPATPPGRARRV